MTKFDFKKAVAAAELTMKNPLLEAIILGPQGAGKSYTIGTMGCKTLHLYGTRESHGPKTARVEGGTNIVPMCFTEYNGKVLSSDESMDMLKAILTDYSYIKEQEFGAIALDGMAVLEEMIKGTTEWGEKCKTAKGQHNTFKETESSMELMARVINWLKGCQRELGVHIVVTGILDVKETDAYGAIVDASPRLGGYGLAESLNCHFGDILVVGKMTRNGESKWKFQFMTDLTRTAKDEHGVQKKSMNFSPRLSGCTVGPIMEADLSKLAEFKKAQMESTDLFIVKA